MPAPPLQAAEDAATSPFSPPVAPLLQPQDLAPSAAGGSAMAPAGAPELRPLIETCQAELGLKPDAPRAARLHFEMGRAHGQSTQALEHYRLAIKHQPDHLPSIRTARALELAARNVSGAVELFDAEIAICSGAQAKAQLYFAKGAVLLDVGDDREAARSCFEQAAKLDPADPTLVAAFEQAELQSKDWAQLAEALATKANAVADDTRLRAAILVQRARLLERRLRDPGGAIEQYALALSLAPHTPMALAELQRLLFAQQRWGELVEMLQREAELSSDAQQQAWAWWRVARIQSERLGAQPQAIEALERAAELSPTNPLLLEELARLYEQTRDDAGLSSALTRLTDSLDRPTDKLGVLLRLAKLHHRPDGDAAAAVRWYEAALALDPGHSPALRALDGLYEQLERWDALAEMCLAEAKAKVDSAERATAYARAADIFESRLGRPEVAVEHYSHALALDPSQQGAFKALVRLHTSAGHHRALIELYDRVVGSATVEDVAISYLFKIGTLLEDTLHDLPGAIETYRRLLARQPNNLGAVHALQRTTEMACSYRELVEALDMEAALNRERDQVLAIEHSAAEVLAERCDEPDQALGRWQAILNRNPRHVPTLMSLGRLLAKLGRHGELLDIYGRQLEVIADATARAALLVEMAEIAERELGDGKRAISLLRQALQLDANHAIANASLARLLRHEQLHQELEQALEAELLAASEPRAVARAALRLGEVREIHLDKPQPAIEAYRRAIEAVPGYTPALHALARVHAEQGSWKELAETLELSAQEQTDASSAASARLLAAMLRSDRLGNSAQATTSLEQLLGGEPDNLAALLALRTLYLEAGRRDALGELYSRLAANMKLDAAKGAALMARARLLDRQQADEVTLRAACEAVLALQPANSWALGTLERVAKQAGDDELLLEVDKRYTQVSSQPEVLEAHFTRLGDAMRQRNPPVSLHAYREALRRHADSLAAIRGLAEVGAALNDAATMVEACRREADWTRNPQVAADLLVGSATLRMAHLGDAAGAIDDCDRALGVCPNHQEAARRLTMLLRQTEDIERLIDKLSLAAHAATDKARKIELWREVGALQSEHHNDPGAAIAAVKRALEIDPTQAATLLQLAAMLESDSQWKEAANLLARAVGVDAGLLSAHLELARIYTEHLDSAVKARASIDRVLAARPLDRDALRMLLKLHISAGDRAQARATADKLLEAAGDDRAMRAWALTEIGRLEIKAGSTDHAAAALHDAVALDGAGGEAATLYQRVLGRDEPWDRYVHALRSFISGADGREPNRLVEAYLAMARAQHSELGHTADAFETLQQAIAHCGEQALLQTEMAELLLASGRHQEAEQAFRRLTGPHPDSALAWRGVVRVLQQLGRQGEAAVAAAPLVLLGEATEVERNLAAERAIRPGGGRPGSMSAAALATISAADGADEGPVAGLLLAVGDALAKVYPVAFEQYGVKKGDRIRPRTGHPLRQDVDRLAAVFGIERFDMYVHAGMGGDVAVELSQPPSLMVPNYLSEMPEAPRLFLLARPLAAITTGLYPALKLSPEELALVLAAAVRHLEPTFEDGHHDTDRLAAMQQTISPSWLSRGKFDEAVQQYYAEPLDALSWAPTVERSATRAAALLAGDLDACVAALRNLGAVNRSATGSALVDDSPLVADLLRFWMSEPARDLRRLGGIV